MADFRIDHDDFRRLTKAAKSRRLIPFVGAGFSRCLNPRFPGWNDVMAQAAADLGYDHRILSSLANNYEIGEMLRRNPGTLHRFVKYLKEHLDAEGLAVIDDSTPHHWLAAFDASCIYTTNWDSWIERALTRAGKTHRVINKPEALHEDRQPVDLVKFHGDLNAPEGMVFAESAYYERMRFEHPFDVLLRRDCLQSSLLFVGYSFTDMNIRLLWNRLWETFGGQAGRGDATCRAYLCIAGDEVIAKHCMTAEGISVIGLDPMNPTESLTALLKQLVEAQS